MTDTKKAEKKIGRPKKFDDEVALQAALNMFWKKGYDGASMKDLTSAMGINSPSLYASYGDKQALFVKTIEHYLQNGSCTPLEVFEQEEDLTLAVKGFFDAVISYSSEYELDVNGCFLGSCVVASVETVPDVKPLLQKAITESEIRLASRFKMAVLEGQLPEDFPCEERAKLMFDLRQGVLFRARSGVASDNLRKDVDFWTSLVLLNV